MAFPSIYLSIYLPWCHTGFIQKIATIFPGLFKDFSRTKLNFQGPPTRNAFSWTVYKFTFTVQANRYLTLQVFVPSPFLHLSVHLPFLFISSGFSIRIEVGGRNVEVSSEGATRAAGRHDLLEGPGACSPWKLLKSEPLRVHFLHSGARIRSFLTEPYMLYFPAFYSTDLIIFQTK